jgi:hypothetical protein
VCLVLVCVTAAGADTVPVPGAFATIQAALDGAPPGSVIQLAPGTYHERVQIGPQHQVTLRGNPDDPASVMLDAGGGGDVIRMIGATSDMVVEGVTLTGGTGNDGYGGGLFMAQSQSVFRRCVFRGNAVSNQGGGACLLESGGLFQECVFESNTAGVYGGGVMLNLGSTTAFDNCTFVDNTAGTIMGGAGSGGGVHVNDSSPTFVGCRFQDNRGKSGGGLLVLGHWDQPESSVSVENSTFMGNVAYRDPGGPSGDGGALHIEDNVHVSLRRCRVQSNVANVGGGVHSYRAPLDIRDSIIEDNQAVDDGVGGFGGGVGGQSVNVSAPPRRPASILLSKTVVRNNSAVVGGGVFIQGDFLAGTPNGILNIEDSLVDNNQAGTQGGGIKVDHADFAITRSHVLRNRVLGGGLTFGGGLVTAAGSATTITNSTFAGNRCGTEGIGGGLYADQGGSLDITRSRFVGNRGGDGGLLGGGAIAIGQTPGPVPGPISGTVTETVIADNGDNNEIFESSCDPAYWSDVVYRDNELHSYGGAVYYRNCTGPTTSVSAFNALGGGKAAGNQDREPTFVEFMATPGSVVTGTSSVLSWIAPAASSLSIDHGVGSVATPFGTADVTPGETTTYALAEGGDDVATAQVDVVCAGIGSPIPLSPANRNGRQTPSHVTLEWFQTLGATSYDVYLDTGAEPATLVASGVTGTTAEVSGLAPSTTYRWRVLANSPACGEPVAGPIFEFSTCANDECAFVDTFDDGDASDWTTFGKGTQRVAAGMLELKSKKRFGMLAPVAPLAVGVTEVRGQLQKGRRNMSLFFAWKDASNYGELVISAGRRWKLRGRVAGKPVRGASARSKLPSGVPFVIRLDMNGSAVSVSRDGVAVMSGNVPGVGEGVVGVGGAFSTVAVDEVKIAATPGSFPR